MRAEPLSIALRADAERRAGLGHIRRLDALAARLGSWARCVLLLDNACPIETATPSRRIGADARAALAAAVDEGADALVVDSYGVAITRGAARAAGLSLVAVIKDDDGPVDADLVVSPGLGPTHGRLAGLRYALIDPAFEAPPERHWPEVPRRLLVVLGGATPAPLMGALVAAALRAMPTVAIDAIVGPSGDPPDVVARPLLGLGQVTLHVAPSDVRRLMLTADVAVSAGGVTLLELAASAVPTVAVTVAANQTPNVTRLSAAGAVVAAGDATSPSIEESVERSLRALADRDRRRELGLAGRRVVDGGGARRVSQALRRRLAPRAAREAVRC